MMADNRVRTAVDFVARELSGIYPPGEVRSMTRLAFAHYFALSPTDLVLQAEATLTESELLKVLHLVRELRQERPIQYILGEAWFDGLRLTVGPEVLIPRPETEELVAWIADTVQAEGLQAPHMLDIGTGSGCIPLALKTRLPEAQLAAWDVS
ncbi:MAG: protein-(glutamine-N5) methyltransferase, release factor-specific, partial [Bacteroidota bacterium]